jgi:molybdopterin molybdotransferase
MISPKDAEQLINACSITTEEEFTQLELALGRTLAEPLQADTALPPFDRVMMDGIALSYATIEAGVRSFRVQALQRAGQPPITLANDNMCIEVMTGAVCPIGCDTVVPYEHIRLEDDVAHVEIPPTAPCKNVHRTGSDKRLGEVLVESGTSITPSEVGIAASIGKANLRVYRLPRILICSTGDELVAIDQVPLSHQIRRSNVYALRAMIQGLGLNADITHLPDDHEVLTTNLKRAAERYEVIILSGGVSKGKFDLLPGVLNSLGIETIFHGIAQRPGKPMWFGKNARVHVFALPGNPVSTLACAARYVQPWLAKQLKRENRLNWVRMKETIQPHENMTLFIPVILQSHRQGLVGRAISHKGSGDFSALSGIDGFIEVPEGSSAIELESQLLFYPIN